MSETVNVNVNSEAQTGESRFDGGLAQLIGWNLLGILVNLITLGFGFPWSLCKVYGWEVKHTIVDGRRLKFDGRAMGLFGLWVKWLLLSVITVGIYGFWVGISLKKWKVKHTHFA
jgi:uncharacterized membrane protein YjgN (DUF898 family)